MSATVLMVAEKPSICTSIAQALCKGKMETHGRSPPVHEFSGSFRGQSATIRVTSVTGHMFSLDFPSKYQNWDAINPLELFSAPTIHSEASKGIVRHLEREAKNVDYLVLWLDCDREGENICYEVIRTVQHLMKRGFRGQTIFRAKFSAVTQKDIEKAMACLGEPNENEALSVDARQELDLKVGVAFSRFQTKYFQGKYGNLDSAIISYGPCQTPTLGFCVDRYDEIQSFTPEPFWSIDCTIEVLGRITTLEWSRGRLFDQGAASTFMAIIGEDREMLCTDVKTSETKKTRPQPLNTIELLKLASKNLGIGPQAAMKAAEHLYLSGFLSYPRTESTAYPASFDIRDALTTIRQHPDLGGYAHELLVDGYNHPRQGVDAGDHPPITPVGVAKDVSGDSARIYDLVVRHFLATVSKDATYMSTKANFIGPTSQEKFTVSGRREIDPGFMIVYGSNRSEDCSDVPEFEKSEKYRIVTVKERQGQTTAPGYLTEAELIGIMEKHGIGTDASISTHINNILVRNYVSLGNGRTLIPTELGVVLVHGYQRIDPDLVLPDVRAAIESFCNLIAKGSASKDVVVQHSLRNFEKKFQHFCANIGAMDSLFEATFSPLAATGKNLSKCGKCNRYMRFIPLKPQRLYCPTCEETYNLPQNGTIKLYKELKCPLDQFELVLFSLGNAANAQGKSYPLCPCCYNHPPSFKDFERDTTDDQARKYRSNSVTTEEKAEGNEERSVNNDKNDEDDDYDEDRILINMGCNNCLHPSCKHSAMQNYMCNCPNATDNGDHCPGMLILDVNSKPNWKLACNRCNTLIRFKAEIHNIIPNIRTACGECSLRTATFEFNKLRTPLKDGSTTYSGCIICDDFLNSLTEIVAGRSINLTVLRQQRYRRNAGGRGRGRGRRGGRGGGRGGNKHDLKMSFADF